MWTMILLIIVVSFVWATVDTLKNNSRQAKQRELARKRETYLKQKEEQLKSAKKTETVKKPDKDIWDKYYEAQSKTVEDTHSKYKPPKQKDRTFAHLGGNAFTWSDDFVKSLEWKRFEEVCCELLKMKGHNAQVTKVGSDGGVDILIWDNDGVVVSVAQCKAFGKKIIGVSLIRELLGVMASRQIKQGLFFTTSSFSNDAIEFAKCNSIKLIDLNAFIKSVNTLDRNHQEKLYKVASQGDFRTPTCVRCDVKMVKRAANTNKAEFWGCPNFPRCRMTINVRA